MREKEGKTPKEVDNRSDFEKLRALLEGRDERKISGKERLCTLEYAGYSGRKRVSVDVKTPDGSKREYYEVGSAGLERVDI